MSLISNTTSIDKYETKYLFVSSANRNSGTNGRFIIYLPSDLMSKNVSRQKKLRLSLYNLNVIYEWYNIQSGLNDSFSLNGTPITIPEGSYSVYQFRDLLNTLITGYTVTYDLISNKYTFTAANPTDILTITNCGQFFGTDNGIAKTGTFTSDYPVNMSLYNSLYLNTDLISGDYSLDNINQGRVNSSTILDTIPISVAPFDIISYQSLNPTSLDINVNNTLSSIEFYLSTDTGVILNNLKNPWTLTLKVIIDATDQGQYNNFY